MIYVDADFLFALIKNEDWLKEGVEQFYSEKREQLYTSNYTLLEMMLVAYREDRDVLKTVRNIESLVEVRGDTEVLKAAASYVEDRDLTPFDALHLAASGEDGIASSDQDYDGLERWIDITRLPQE